jgi:hypothetical protein
LPFYNSNYASPVGFRVEGVGWGGGGAFNKSWGLGGGVGVGQQKDFSIFCVFEIFFYWIITKYSF